MIKSSGAGFKKHVRIKRALGITMRMHLNTGEFHESSGFCHRDMLVEKGTWFHIEKHQNAGGSSAID